MIYYRKESSNNWLSASLYLDFDSLATLVIRVQRRSQRVGKMRPLLVPAVLLVGAFGGCLQDVQDAFQFNEEPTPEPFPESVEFSYEVIPGEVGAYQFQVPPGAEKLRLEAGEGEEDDDEASGEPSSPETGEEEKEKAGSEAFALFTVDGARIDPVRESDEWFSFRVSHPDAGAYVLQLYDDVDHTIQLSLEARRSELLESAAFNAAVLPLSGVTQRTLLAERKPGEASEMTGHIEYAFPPHWFMFSYVGTGTGFFGSVSSRSGLVYEQDSGFLAVGLGNTGFFASPMGGHYGTVETASLEGTTFDWSISTDLVGKVYLTAWTHQPAPPIEAAVTVEGASDDLSRAAGSWDIVDGKVVGDANWYTGEATLGDEAYVFTVPEDADALLLQTTGGEVDCDPYWYPYDCGAGFARVGLYDASGARLGLFELGEGERLRLTSVGAGDHTLFVHAGDLEVNVGVAGPPPSSARLHKQPLVALAVEQMSLTRTATATVPLAIEGIPLLLDLEVDCPSMHGVDFSASVASAAGMAYATDPEYAGQFGGFDLCFTFGDGPVGRTMPEALVEGDYTFTLDVTGGVGSVTLKVLGLKGVGRAADDDEGGAPPGASLLERLIG